MKMNLQLDQIAPLSCNKCPRLVTYLNETKEKKPSWFNAPVPSFGSINSEILIIGLAPGLRGANRTGRPFTGDFAGEILYQSLFFRYDFLRTMKMICLKLRYLKSL